MAEIGPDFQITRPLAGDRYQHVGYAKTPAAEPDIRDCMAAVDRTDVFGKKAISN